MNGRDFDRTQETAGDSAKSGMSARLRALAFAAVVALAVTPAGVAAQGLPTADDLEAEQPADEEVEAEAPAEEEQPEEPEQTEPAQTEPAQTEAPQSETPAAGVDGADQAEETLDAPADDVAADMSVDDDTRYAAAGINLEGARGFQHITSAIAGKPNTYRVGFLGNFTKGSDIIRYQDENEFVGGNLLFQATILEYLSANIGVRATNNVNTFGRPQAMLAQGDVHFGLRGHYMPRPGFHIAGDMTVFFPTGFSSAGLDASATSFRPRMLATAELGEFLPEANGKKVPLTAHFNFGFLADNSSALLPDGMRPTRVERFAHGISAYDYLQFGLGFEYALPYVSPFLAWNLDVPVNPDAGVCAEAASLECVSEEGFAAFPDTLSLGVRGEPVENLGLTAGVDIGLTGADAAGIPVTPPWQMIVGASWAIDPEPKIEYVEKIVEKEKVVDKTPAKGFIVGNVTDEKTGEPIAGAIIRYMVEGKKTPQATSPQGTFLSYGFDPGKEVQIEVSHPDYHAAEARQMIDGEGQVELAVSLKSIPKQGTVGGTVIDQEGNPIPNASIKLTGPDAVEVTTGVTGKFQKEVAAGDYTVAASAEGFLTGGRDAAVASNKELQLEITLKPEPKEKLVEVQEDRIRIKQKVFFETGKAKILPRSYDVLNQVASVLLETPRIETLRIEGHTDDVGAEDYNLELSQSRADSVRKYLIEQGISQERVKAKGFGESQPLVPNASDRNRSLNRRVEFRIVDQGLDKKGEEK